MSHKSVGAVVVVVLAVLVLASLLLFSSGNGARAGHGPTLGTVDFVDIDMDVITPGIQTSADNVGVGFTQLIDIAVDEVHPADGYQGAAFNLLYDPAVVEVVSKAHGVFTYDAAPLFVFSESLITPDTDGNWRYDEGALGGVGSGTQAIVRLGIKCIAAGQSFLDLADNIGGDGIPDIFVPPAGAPIGPGGVLSSADAQIGCNVAAATPADVEIVTETVHGPANMAVNTPTAYKLDKKIKATGGEVDVILATSIIPPAGCIAREAPGGTVDIDSTLKAINTVSAAKPAVVTTDAPHGLTTGDTVVISGVAGTHAGADYRDVNHVQTITKTGASTFTINGVKNFQAGAGGSVSLVIGTSHAALAAEVSKTVDITLTCSAPAFYNFKIENQIFLDPPKLYGTCSIEDLCRDSTPGNNKVSHNGAGEQPPTVAGPNETTETPEKVGEQIRVCADVSATVCEIDHFQESVATVTLDTPLGAVTVTLTGPTTIEVDFITLGDVSDECPSPGGTDSANGLEEVQTEMVQLELTGTSPLVGPVTVRLRDPSKHPNQKSTGLIEENINHNPGTLDIPPFIPEADPPDTACSFFDVFFEVEIASLPPFPLILHSHDVKRMMTTITHKPPTKEEYTDGTPIILFDEAENATDIQIMATRHSPGRTPSPTPTGEPSSSPIGGIAELFVDGLDAPRSADEAFGSAASVIIAGAAAGLALFAGAWYARRRWLR